MGAYFEMPTINLNKKIRQLIIMKGQAYDLVSYKFLIFT